MKKHSYEGFHYWFDGYKNAWVIQRDGHPDILFHCDPNERPEREIDEYWKDNKGGALK